MTLVRTLIGGLLIAYKIDPRSICNKWGLIVSVSSTLRVEVLRMLDEILYQYNFIVPGPPVLREHPAHTTNWSLHPWRVHTAFDLRTKQQWLARSYVQSVPLEADVAPECNLPICFGVVLLLSMLECHHRFLLRNLQKKQFENYQKMTQSSLQYNPATVYSHGRPRTVRQALWKIFQHVQNCWRYDADEKDRDVEKHSERHFSTVRQKSPISYKRCRNGSCPMIKKPRVQYVYSEPLIWRLSNWGNGRRHFRWNRTLPHQTKTRAWMWINGMSWCKINSTCTILRYLTWKCQRPSWHACYGIRMVAEKLLLSQKPLHGTRKAISGNNCIPIWSEPLDTPDAAQADMQL